MSKAIEALMTEHRLIEKVLGSLRSFADQLAPGQPGSRRRVADYAEFFREYADRCHHGKEEDRLFGVMAEHGFPTNAGPVFVMLQEHNVGRARVRSLAEVGGGDGELSREEITTVQSRANEFIALLAAHIQKEDKILFPAAESSMPAPVLEALAGEFDEFDNAVIGEATHERLHTLARTLIAEFPPDMGALNIAGGCGAPCGG